MFLSIIIPTLNEAKHLAEAVQAVRINGSAKIDKEVIVIDAGSQDGTQDIARALNVRLIVEPNMILGKFHLLNRGAEEAKGDVFLFLDADSILPVGYDEDIRNVVDKRGFVGGAFEFTLAGEDFGLRVVELVNRTRYRLWPRYYGDQGIFVRADIFRKIGGYPPLRIMEGSHFCAALAKQGKLKLVRKPMVTSPRRFLKGGIYKVLGMDFKIWWLDLIGKSVEHFAEPYWKQNKERRKELCHEGN